METKYITSITDLKYFCEADIDRRKIINGECRGCPRYKECLQMNKEQNIDSAIHMLPDEFRFPGLHKLVHNNPSFLWCIPPTIYKRVYGTFRRDLPCQFCSGEYLINNIEKIEEVLDILTDAYSRLVLLNILMYRMKIDPEYILRAYSLDPQYFIFPFRGLNHNEVYVDCGAYNGDSFEKYCYYNSTPKAAYLFEPNMENCRLLNQTVLKYKDNCSVHVIGKGVHSSTGRLNFALKRGMGSHYSSEETGVDIEVTSIDDVVDENITFIKMDIEGSEQNAIIGAKNHILNSYPKLAICIYHSTKDLWEIPILIKNMFPEYTHFEIRHHSKLFYETVLYVYK